MTTEIKLPELGENIESAEVLSVLVSAGDTVEKDQPLIELETDKATAEVPAETAGVIKEVRVKAGDAISVGQIILVIEESNGGPATASEPEAPAKSKSKSKAAPTPKAEAAKPAPPKAKPAPEPVAEPEPGEEPEAEEAEEAGEAEDAAKPEPVRRRPAPAEDDADDDAPLKLIDRDAPLAGAIEEVAAAAPSVRRLARELGIDIHTVQGSGPAGRISLEDIKTHARRLISRVEPPETTAAPEQAAPGTTEPELPDFSAWGETEREPASKVRRLTAQAMSLSWTVIPHVTQHDRSDITDLEAWRKRTAPKVEQAGGKLTITAIIVKALAGAMKVYPQFNASYDVRNEEIVLKKYLHIGVAVDTERGLLVPVIRDADRKNITEIAADLGDLADRARSRKIKAEELQGANINLSNLGGLGTTDFSPIVAWPQVAVLGVGRAIQEAVYRDGAFVPRLILPLSISYDHRVIDGADAARFLRWIAEALEEPLLMALEG